MSVSTPDFRHSLANRKAVVMPLNRNAHHRQLPATPSVRTNHVTRFGVSVEKVVATMETPSSHHGIDRLARKYSAVPFDARLASSAPMTIHRTRKPTTMTQSTVWSRISAPQFDRGAPLPSMWGRNRRMASEPTERMKASDSVTRVVTFAALVLLFFAVAVNQIADFDFWWLWATGRHVAENGIPRTDAFSFASEGRPWIELRWLFCLGLYGASETLGYAGANLIKVGVLGITAGLTACVSRAWSPVAGVAVGLLAILAASPRFIIRPEIASYLFFALFLFLIARHREGNRKTLFLLPLLQVVWVNTHTVSFWAPWSRSPTLPTPGSQARRMPTCGCANGKMRCWRSHSHR